MKTGKIVQFIIVLFISANLQFAQTGTTEYYKDKWAKLSYLYDLSDHNAARKILSEIKSVASKNKDYQQLLKAFQYEIATSNKKGSFLDQYSLINQIENEIKKTSFPVNAVLQNYLAEIYIKVYQNENFINPKEEKFKHFNSLSKTEYLKFIDSLFQVSLKEEDKLKNIPSSEYTEILFDKENISYYPSLFDILSHCLLKFYLNNENEVNNEDLFLFADSTYLMPHQQFLKLKINDTPHFSIRNKAAKLLQRLTSAHNETRNYTALLNLELTRINALYKWSVFINKKVFLEKSYKELEEYFSRRTNSKFLLLDISRYYSSRNIDNKYDLPNSLKYAIEAEKCDSTKILQGELKRIRNFIFSTSFSVETEKYNLPDKPFRLLVKYKNVKNLYLRIIKNDDMMKSFFAEKVGSSENGIYRFLRFFKSENYHLPIFNDYQSHSTEIMIQPLPLGDYILLFSETDDFSGATNNILNVSITNIDFVKIDEDETNLYLFTDRETGAPLNKVLIKSDNYLNLTNNDGIIEITRDEILGDKKYTAYYKDDKIVFDIKTPYYNHKEKIDTNIRTTFYTDRAIYRPGQTVKFKGIQSIEIRNGEKTITKNKETKITLFNTKSEGIADITLTINEYGSFSGEFILPLNGLTGRYEIGDMYGAKDFKVEEYKKPTFQVTINRIEEHYALGDSIRIVGTVESFSGESVQNFKLVYNISENTRYKEEIADVLKKFKDDKITDTTIIKNDGTFCFSFSSNKMYKDLMDEIFYNISVDVTNLTGETISGTINLRVPKEMKNEIHFQIPNYVFNDTTKFMLNLNQFTKIENKVKIIIHQYEDFKRPFRDRLWSKPDTTYYGEDFYLKYFPYDVYWDENEDNNLKIIKTVLDTNITYIDYTELGLLKNKKLKNGIYSVTFIDSYHNSTIKKYFRYFNLEENKLAENIFIWINENIPKVIPGKSAKIFVGSSLKNINMFYTISNKDSIIQMKWVNLKDSISTIEIPFPANEKSPLIVNFFSNNFNQNYRNVISLIPDLETKKNEIKIKYESFRNLLNPGSTEIWKLKVFNKDDDKPVSAEVLAGLYDASLDDFIPNIWYKPWFGYFNNNYYPRLSSFTYKTIKSYNRYDYYQTDRWHSYINRQKILNIPYFKFLDDINTFYNLYKEDCNVVLIDVESGKGFCGIKGRIINYKTKRGISNVKISIEDGTLQTFSNNFGYFTLFNIKEGNNNIYFEKDGFYTVKLSNIIFTNDKVTNYYIPLTIKEKNEKPIITGQALGQKQAINQQLVSNTIKNIVSSEREEDSDYSAADALSRLPGVSLMNGDQTVIRGVDAKLNQVLINGVAMPNTEISEQELDNLSAIQSRQNLQETAFFYPHIETDENGEATITFTVPEALTKWKFQSIAHTKDLKFAYKMAYAITQKTLMIKPNPPRFLRAGDTVIFSANLSNISKENLTGVASLNLIDASNDKPIDALFGNANPAIRFSADSGQTILVDWVLKVPEDFDGELIYEVKAAAGNYTDGERNSLPVLPNKFYVIETKPFVVNGNETKSITFDSFKENNSPTRQNINYSFDYTTNSFWYVIKSLPYLMEFPHECAEQMFARYYSNAVASQVLKKIPNIKNIIADKNSEIVKYQLANNPKLKSTLLEETPWKVENSKNNFSVLLDSVKINSELARVEKRLIDMCENDGGFPWFKGMQTSYYVSQHILTGFGKLRKSGFIDIEKKGLKSIITNGLNYLDKNKNQRYWEQKNNEKDKYFYADEFISYLYCRSYFKDIKINEQYDFKIEEILDSLKFNKWNSLMCNGMKAIVLSRYDKKDKALAILDSIKIRAEYDYDSSMYFSNYNEYYWYSAPIETQALILSAFKEITNDVKTVSRMQTWLIKQHKNSSWQTTKATTEAISALLMNNENWLIESTPPEIKIGNDTYTSENVKNLYSDEAMGKLTLTWENKEINKSLADVTVTNKNDYPGFGGLFWQYYDNYENIDTSKSNTFKIKKQIFRKSFNSTEFTPLTAKDTLNQGEKVLVRLTIKSEIPVDFIHIKDNRAPGFEPIDVISGMNYGGGLRYYKSTRDASTNFYIDYLPSGQYAIEFELRATHRGVFSGGITTIQSMYAPENSAHANSPKVNIK